jgi:catechol 2,3-dioxygenase-like lactoylglutathione lyase family enzyme
MPQQPRDPSEFVVHALVPYAHVADVDRSIAFYARLGFRIETRLADPGGVAFWARLRSGTADLMLARASGPIDPTEQAVLFYMYSSNVRALREHLLAVGHSAGQNPAGQTNELHDGGRFTGAPGPNDGRSVVFAIAHPGHMLAGELRVSDPDGYCILIGQRS